ncbi:hypothetical protein [Chitiniphilus eburneus]|uniref:Uncharacterized protein n=1 Tax=Chitiniphilus eburneus TaxID=2571148 RepID=A0A4U0QCM7_9NEIS|nr:hypothetical protein [Chitiniphilus eburneus]TJZ78890.1 hypothetical protein FAZ21_00980 [Chitiniphilus eburneus]
MIWIPLVFGLIALMLSVVGLIFGLMAVPTINEKLGLVCILFPILVPLVCLLNYRKTKYASNFFLGGSGSLLLAGISAVIVLA